MGGEGRNNLPDQLGWWIQRFLWRFRRVSNGSVLSLLPSFTGTNHIIVQMEILVDQETYTLCYSRISGSPKTWLQVRISSPKGTKSVLHEEVLAGQVNQNIKLFVLWQCGLSFSLIYPPTPPHTQTPTSPQWEAWPHWCWSGPVACSDGYGVSTYDMREILRALVLVSLALGHRSWKARGLRDELWKKHMEQTWPQASAWSHAWLSPASVRQTRMSSRIAACSCELLREGVCYPAVSC